MGRQRKGRSSKAEQVWPPLLEDVFGFHKWFPTLSVCLPVKGVSGQPGCVRFCAGFKTPVDKNGEAKERVNRTKQKLLAIDAAKHTFSCSIADGNVGFNGYVSTVEVEEEEEDGCSIKLSYEVEPWKVGNQRIWTLLWAKDCKS